MSYIFLQITITHAALLKNSKKFHITNILVFQKEGSFIPQISFILVFIIKLLLHKIYIIYKRLSIGLSFYLIGTFNHFSLGCFAIYLAYYTHLLTYLPI